MKTILLLCSAFVLCAVNVSAQKEDKAKPWTEWTEKEALKVLSDSPWAQTQKELTDSGSGSSGGAVTRAAENGANASIVKDSSGMESGQNVGNKNTSLTLYYHMSFLSAKPVRQAFIRIVELQRPDTPAETVAARRAFIDQNFGEYIVVTLKMDGTDRKKLAPAMQTLTGAKIEAFKDLVYLERKDGKRVSISDYRAPGPDGMGAKFIFPRTFEGKPFLDAGSGEVRVYMEINKTKLTRKFKVADMMYDGKLEY